MKHHFEEWYEKLHYKREISDSVKELFEESVKCYKAGVYRSAIVMGFTGFSMLIRDRVYSYRRELKTETELDDKKDNISIEDTDFQDENSWDIDFNHKIINTKESKFTTIFEGQSDFRKGWLYWRALRNVGAHSKSYKLSHNDIESLYNWIIQAEHNLHPFVSYKKWIITFQEYTDDKMSPNTNPSEIIDNLVKLNKVRWNEFLDELTRIIKDKLIDENEKLIECIDLLYKYKQSEMDEYFKDIINNKKLPTGIISKLFNSLCEKNSFYVHLDDNTQFLLIKYIDNVNVLLNFADQGLDEIQIKQRLSNINLSNISSSISARVFISDELTKRCRNFKESSSFIVTRNILDFIPLNYLNEDQIQLILEGLENNAQIYDYAYIKSYLNEPYQQWKTKFPNLDYGKSDKRIN